MSGLAILRRPTRDLIAAIPPSLRTEDFDPAGNVLTSAEAGTDTATTQWVVFRCGGRHFGVPLVCVAEILLAQPFTRLPGTGPDVCGIVGVRGHVITVLDFGVLLGTQASGTDADHRLLLLDVYGRRIGAAVDDVTDVAPGSLNATGAPAGELPPGAVVGTGRCGDTLFTALDPESLIAHLLDSN